MRITGHIFGVRFLAGSLECLPGDVGGDGSGVRVQHFLNGVVPLAAMADAETLQTLPGIGPAKAAAIIAYREEHGPFAALQDVANVPGISEQMTEKWAGLAQTGTPAEKAP